MSQSTRYGLGPVVFNASVLGGITSLSLPHAHEVRREGHTGEIVARAAYLVSQKTSASFSTLAVGTALSYLGSTGLSLANLAAGLTLYSTRFQSGGAQAATHRKFNAAAGIAVPRSLSVDHGGDANLLAEVMAVTNGVNEPWVYSEGNSLPNLPTTDERYGLGAVLIGGVSVTGVRSVSIDFGVTVEGSAADGDAWDTVCHVTGISPRITLRGVDLTWYSTGKVPFTGRACTKANTLIALRRRSPGGVYYPDGTAVHCLIGAYGLATVPEALSASGMAPGEASIEVACVWDGANDPLAIAYNTAL